jgi:hypothetical protein
MSDYVIAIPSYKRHHALKQRTLRVLDEGLVDFNKIHIFVADDEEYTLYHDLFPEYNIILGYRGLKEQRNFILDYFPLNTKIISIDDDIESIEIFNSMDNRLHKIEDLDYLFKKCFEDCEREKCNLFGFYPVRNAYFMKETFSTDLKFIIGSCYGFINKRLYQSISEKDDYERSILFYLRDKKVLRYNYITIKTKYYKNNGGLQTFKNRFEEQLEAVKILLLRYPELVKRKKSFKSGFPEIRLIKSK